MARVGVFEKAPTKWFPYDSDTEVQLKHIDKGRVNTILMNGAEAAKKLRAKPGPVQDIFLGREAVLGWRHKDQETNPGHPGLLLPDGTPIPFTPGNRNLVMTKSQRFSEWVYGTCTNELNFIDDDVPQLDGEDLAGLDELLEKIGEDDNLGNV